MGHVLIARQVDVLAPALVHHALLQALLLAGDEPIRVGLQVVQVLSLLLWRPRPLLQVSLILLRRLRLQVVWVSVRAVSVWRTCMWDKRTIIHGEIALRLQGTAISCNFPQPPKYLSETFFCVKS